MVSTWCRTGCLALTLLAVANQQAHAEEAGTAPAAKPVEAAPAAAPAETPPAAKPVDAAPAAAPAPAETPPAAKPVDAAPAAKSPETTAPAAVVPATAGEAAAAKPTAGPAKLQPAAGAGDGVVEYPVHGFINSRYLLRWTGEASDQDIYETVSLDAGDPERNRVTGHFLGDCSIDIDGQINNHGNYAYDSARDSSGSNVVPRVYSCYLDANRVGPLSIIRAGRQSLYDTPEIAFFDGLRVESEELGGSRVKLGAYGGVPVHLYEGYSTQDLLSGAYVQGHLWQGARARVDWQRLEGHNDGVVYENTLMGFGGWQSLGQHVDLHAHYTSLDYHGRDVLLRGSFNQPDWDCRFQTSYYQLLTTRQGAVIEADAYYPILKDYLPYRESRSMVSKGFGDIVNVDLGLDVRRLAHDDQATAFNHEFNRYFATLDLLDLLGKGSSISLTEEKWVSQDRNTESQGLDITCPITAMDKVSLGTAHYLFKYDYYADQERDDVQAYYFKLVHKHSSTLRFSVNYEFEDDRSSENYNELRFEVLWSF